MCFFCGLFMRTTLVFILGRGVLQFLNDAVLLFEGFDIMAALTPVCEVMAFTQLRTFFNSFADSVEE